MLAMGASISSCTLAGDCPTEIRFEGRLANQDLDTMKVEGSSFWGAGLKIFNGLPLSVRFRINFKDLLKESATTKESADNLRALWDPDFSILLKGSGEEGEADLSIRFFFLGGSNVKIRDPIPVYDGTLIRSIYQDDLDGFVRLRENVDRWMSAKQPFALVRAYVPDPDNRPGFSTWKAERYASSGEVVISEFWPRIWKKLESFENFGGAAFGRIYRVSANADLHFLTDRAQISTVRANAYCINARKVFTTVDETTQ